MNMMFNLNRFSRSLAHAYQGCGRLARSPTMRTWALPDAAKPVINKQPTVLVDNLYSYMFNHTREPEVLARLRVETSGVKGARMQITPEQGAFMALLAQLIGVTRYLEIGVFTGYSSLAVALALPPGSKVVALDIDDRPVEMARRYWEEGGVLDKIDCRIGPAAESLKVVEAEYGAGSFDLAFVDADKRGYRDYYETLLKLVRPGGLIALDNVLWYGKVADEQVTDKATVHLRELNAFLMTDSRIDFSIVPIGDGVALCRVKPLVT